MRFEWQTLLRTGVAHAVFHDWGTNRTVCGKLVWQDDAGWVTTQEQDKRCGRCKRLPADAVEGPLQ